MQKAHSKKLSFFFTTPAKWCLGAFFVIVLLFPYPSRAQDTPSALLLKADSLFQLKRYTQSIKIYQEILHYGQSSPAMLLKMAYISEALKQKAPTLYYLNLYYLQTGDEKALEKINTHAADWGLNGFESSAFDQLTIFLSKNRSTAQLIALLPVILLIFLTLRAKLKNSPDRIPLGLLSVLFTVAALAVINIKPASDLALVRTDAIPAMEGPSPGSKKISFLKEGTRLEIIEKDPVWTALNVDGEKVYVRTHHLFQLSL